MHLGHCDSKRGFKIQMGYDIYGEDIVISNVKLIDLH